MVGFHPVREALRARRRLLLRLRVREGLRHPDLPELVALARGAGVAVEAVSAERLAAGLPAELRSQGLVLEAGPLPELDLEVLLREAGERTRRLVLLDGVEDPQNLGAVARVAEASGACGLVLAVRRAPPLGSAASRASAGALEHLPVARVVNLRRALDRLGDAGFWRIGCDPEAEATLWSTPDALWTGDLALVLGAEGRGVRPGVRAALDLEVRIPLAGRVASLNVASAAAVVLFDAARRARPSGMETRRPGASPRN